MSLNNFYKLRKNFILLGLTGKMRSGSDVIVDFLKQENLDEKQIEFQTNFQETYKSISDGEASKIRRINDFFQYDGNWVKFEVLDYRNVLLLFMLDQNYDKDSPKFAENLANWICNLGDYKEFETPRFGGSVGIAAGSDTFLKTEFKNALVEPLSKLNITFEKDTLLEFLGKTEDNFFFSENFKQFAILFYKQLDAYSPFLRHKLMHVSAYCLRRFGTLEIEIIKEDSENLGLNHIYIIANAINQLIKIHRRASVGVDKDKVAHVIIDRLKNSYELMYFKEKYSGFYMIASNCNETERKKRIKEKYDNLNFKTDKEENLKLISKLDETEYKVKEFKKGFFDSFDVENCVQKADYHTYLNKVEDNETILKTYSIAVDKLNDKKNKELEKTNEFYVYQPLSLQLLKLIALIQQPGLITPTYIERIMQIAHTTKLNSGCISRQVGAVVTDSSFSVKGIGWNDVPQGQAPCANRDLRDLINEKEKDFTQFELGDTDHKYKDGKSFNEKIKADYSKSSNDLDKKLEGRPCAYCFKTFHNKYEGVDNQVHTRSLHAEENAMLQIAKNGGQGLYKGNLFTTASPCELCSKKAFQLGIKNIFYIDLYPGISEKHILQGGMKSTSNPNLYQFQGVIGRGYQKLYEPFMTIKDETILRSEIEPTPKPKSISESK